jgi:hypothetical protein
MRELMTVEMMVPLTAGQKAGMWVVLMACHWVRKKAYH